MNITFYIIIVASMGALASIGLIALRNYEYSVPLLHLKPWYILIIVLSAVTAGMAYLKRKQSSPNARIWYKALVIMVALHAVMFGIESIISEESVVNYVAFYGKEAVVNGVAQILFGLGFIVMAYYR